MKIGYIGGRKCWVPDDMVTEPVNVEPVKEAKPEKTVETVEEPETKAKPKSANKAKTSTANKSRKAGS